MRVFHNRRIIDLLLIVVEGFQAVLQFEYALLDFLLTLLPFIISLDIVNLIFQLEQSVSQEVYLSVLVFQLFPHLFQLGNCLLLLAEGVAVGRGLSFVLRGQTEHCV